MTSRLRDKIRDNIFITPPCLGGMSIDPNLYRNVGKFNNIILLYYVIVYNM